MADVEKYVEDTMEAISLIGDDMKLLTQEESAEFFEGVASECRTRAETIRQEIEAADEEDDEDEG